MCWSLYLLLSFLFLRASLVAQRVKNLPLMWETRVWSLGWEAPLEKEMAYPLQYSYLENPMHRGAWRTTIPGVSKNQTWLSDWHFHFFHFFVPQTSSGNKHPRACEKAESQVLLQTFLVSQCFIHAKWFWSIWRFEKPLLYLIVPALASGSRVSRGLCLSEERGEMVLM